jgi:hypothetical protein
MSEKIEVEFKFKVGDLVMPAATAHLIDELEMDHGRWISGEPVMRYIVQERLYQQCYNATQIHYTCKCVHRNGGMYKDNIQFTEPQLAPATPFKTKAEIDELRKKAKEAQGNKDENEDA